MKLLQIDSSARSSSVTRPWTTKFVEEGKQNHFSGEVMQRDLAIAVLPHITDDGGGTDFEPSQLTLVQRNYLSTSGHLIEELQAADMVVMGASMYNFAIPSFLKVWIDQTVRKGKTLGYGPSGGGGLLGQKAVMSSRRGAGSWLAAAAEEVPIG
jgi:FMN-dependent NADH-azoreductase